MPRIEVRRHLLSRDNRYVVRQRRIDRFCDTLRGRAAFDIDADDIAERVHAGIRPPCNGKVGIRGKDSERVAHDSFDRAQARLHRPAAEMRAVILER
jgi:hypothetical protein